MTSTTIVKFQPETIAAMGKIPRGCVNEQSMERGIQGAEPLLLILDGLLRIAKAHQHANEAPLASDGYAAPYWLDTARNVRKLLSCNGAVAMERGYGTDSKDNGALETIFWDAIHAAGFTDEQVECGV